MTLLVPLAMMLLAVLAGFVLLLYRTAIGVLVAERQNEARRLAQFLADRSPAHPSEVLLRQFLTTARGIAIIDPAGTVRLGVGALPATPLLSPLDGVAPPRALALGPEPGRGLDGLVVGFAPMPGGGVVRVDLEGITLARHLASLPWTSAVVLGASGLTLLFVLVVVRQFLAPFEALIARVRGLSDEPQEDDASVLLSTFDRALEALASFERRGDGGTAEHPLLALGSELAPRLEGGLLLLDAERRVLAANPRVTGLLSLGAPAPSEPLAAYLAGHHELSSRLEQSLAGAGATPFVWPLAGTDPPLSLGITTLPLVYDGGVRGHLVLLTDATMAHRQATEQALAASLGELAELSAGVAHELRNGLATLIGYLGMAAAEATSQPSDNLTEALTEARNLSRVVSDFLVFASPGTLRPRPVDLRALAAASLAEPELAAAIVTSDLGGQALVEADAALLRQAWRNLLLNAVQASCAEGRRGRLRVALERHAVEFELSVEDDGPGLPAAVRARRFRPFVSGKAGGAGLGLAMAHRIVTLHHGRLELNDRPGGGTRASLYLPGRIESSGNGSSVESTETAP